MALGYYEPLPGQAKTTVKGKVISTQQFRFDCGFEVPTKQIQWLVSRTLKVGDKVSITIDSVRVDTHEHKFVCKDCGESHD